MWGKYKSNSPKQRNMVSGRLLWTVAEDDDPSFLLIVNEANSFTFAGRWAVDTAVLHASAHNKHTIIKVQLRNVKG